MFLGLDLSLGDSGVVLINDSKIIIKESIKSYRIFDFIRDRFLRYSIIVNQLNDILFDYFKKIKCIAIENYSFGSSGRIVQLAESGGLIRNFLIENLNDDVDIIEVAPISLKKFITGQGKGKQTKNIIIREIYKKYGYDIDNDNVADAFILAKIAELYYYMRNNIILEKIYHKYQEDVVKNIIKKNNR